MRRRAQLALQQLQRHFFGIAARRVLGIPIDLAIMLSSARCRVHHIGRGFGVGRPRRRTDTRIAAHPPVHPERVLERIAMTSALRCSDNRLASGADPWPRTNVLPSTARARSPRPA